MSVARNTLYLTFASIAQKVIAFGYFTLLANRLGVAQTGSYFLALSIIVMFSVLADWGVTSVVIRDTAAHPGQAIEQLRRALGVKIPLIVIAAVSAFLFSRLLGYSAQTILLVELAVPILAADALSVLFYGLLRGLQILRYEALGIFVGQMLTAIIGGLVLWISPALPLLILALLSGSIWNMVFAGAVIGSKIGFRSLVPLWKLPAACALLRLSMAFGLAGVFVKLYSSIDSILLSVLRGEEAVGIYAVAYKMTYAFQFLPLAFVGALYPAMSSLVTGDRVALRRLFDRSITYMALLSVPITLGIASTADLLIHTFYPNGYEDSIVALRILVFVLLFIFLDFPVGSLLNAAHKQNIKTAVMGVTMLINLLLNILLIPRYGVIGACVAAVVSFVILFVGSFWFVRHIIDYNWMDLIRRLYHILVAGGLMVGGVLLLKPLFPLVFLVPIGGLIYVAALVVSGELHLDQWRQLRRSLARSSAYEETKPIINA